MNKKVSIMSADAIAPYGAKASADNANCVHMGQA